MIATCPHCGGQLTIIDPDWSRDYQLARCDDCKEEVALPKHEQHEWQQRKDLA